MSVKNLGYSLLAIISLIAGLILIAIQKNLIILNFKTNQLASYQPKSTASYFKKTVTLYFWQNEQWQVEKNDILWQQDSASNLTNLIQNWLLLASEEQIIKNKISLQAVLISQNKQTAYLSFDQPLFNPGLSTYQKLLIIESLLKTMRVNQTGIQDVQFLVQHQMMLDPHLDFTRPWIITGFLKN